MKVDKANIIGAANPDSGARQARVRAGANITIIKANSASVPPSPGFHTGMSISRGASPLTAVSNSSRNSRSNFSDQTLRSPSRSSPNGPFNFANVGERRPSRSSIHPTDCTYRSTSGYSPTLVQLPLPSITQVQTFEPQIVTDEDSDVDSDISDDTHVSKGSKANSSHSEGTEHSSSTSHSGNSSLASDISSSYAVEARVNRKILDLEISNKSLLAVNQVLESKVHKQRSELEALKRDIMKLNSGSPMEPSQSKVEDEMDYSENDECEQQFNRIINRFDSLIAEGRQALEYKPPAIGGRVLLPSAL